MAYTPTCLVCQKEMILGFMTDHAGLATVNVPRWCEGTPQSSMLGRGEVKSTQHAQGLPVIAYRCPKCEALRLYAPSTNQT